MLVGVQPVNGSLSPINLTDVGVVTRIYGSAFVAGKVPLHVAEEIRKIGMQTFRKQFPQTSIEIDAFRAPENRCHGSVSTFL